MNESEKKAFQLMTICNFILARTPMVVGYAEHNEISSRLTALITKIPHSSGDTADITESKGWEQIQKILDI